MTESRESYISQQQLDGLGEAFTKAMVCVRNSTTALRKAYHQDEALLNSETMRYRRYLYTEGVQYGTKVYPRTLHLVSKVKGTLQSYVYLNEVDFLEAIDEIRTECLELSKQALQVQIAHTYVLAHLKRLDTDIVVSRDVATATSTELQLKEKELREQAEVVGVGTLFVGTAVALLKAPWLAIVVGAVGTMWESLLKDDSIVAKRGAYAANQNKDTLELLMRSVSDLTDAVTVISEFITNLADDLEAISEVGVGQAPKKWHFKVMHGASRDLVNRCSDFIAIEPAITSDLHSIKEKLDTVYIQEWNEGLEKSLKYEPAEEISD